ncbi:hypothetical protein SK128_015346 [Halocaridina rubra]|uniref:Uncharacterized protein n=1 Tax=Halocaridina rubra TaxID=373956 RepID=A0AAN9AD59_HALRR
MTTAEETTPMETATFLPAPAPTVIGGPFVPCPEECQVRDYYGNCETDWDCKNLVMQKWLSNSEHVIREKQRILLVFRDFKMLPTDNQISCNRFRSKE